MRIMVLIGLLVCARSALAQPSVVAVYPSDAGGQQMQYHVQIDGLDGLTDGSILVAYRRVPAFRGDASFRDRAVWLESGRLQIVAMGPLYATATRIDTPAVPLPALDDDGVPRDRVCIGDRVLETGEVGLTEQTVVGRFELTTLFSGRGDVLSAEARETLRVWTSRFGIVDTVRVDVSVPGPRPPPVGHPPTTHERVSPMPLRGAAGWAEIRRVEEERTLAQRRARKLAEAVEAALGFEAGAVLATVSWADDAVSEPQTATVRLTRAVVVPSMRPGDQMGEAP